MLPSIETSKRCTFAMTALAIAVASTQTLAADKITNEDYAFENGEALAGIVVSGENSSNVTGTDILIRTEDNASPGINAQGTDADHLATLKIGSDDTESVRVETKLTQGGAAGANLIKDTNAVINGKTIEFTNDANLNDAAALRLQGKGTKLIGSASTESIRIENSGYYGLVVLLTNNAETKLTAKNITIATHKANGSAIHVQNSVTDETGPNNYAPLRLEGDRIRLDADTGITALSHANITVVGDLVIDAYDAISARGDSIVSINADGKHSTQITGNVNFNYDDETSGSNINGKISINLNGEGSYWNGAAVKYWSKGVMPDDPTLNVVKDFHLTVADGAQWNAAVVENPNYKGSVWKEAALNKLELNNGIVNVIGTDHKLAVETLSGTGGTVNLETKLANDGAITSAKFVVTDEESAANAKLVAKLVGITADDVTAEDAASALADAVAYAGETEGHVAEGDLRGAISTKIVDGKVQEGSTTQDSNTKLDDLVGVNASALVQWRNEINHLTKRMGDLRANSGEVGAWARIYGGESRWDSGSVEMKSTSVQAGGDVKLSDEWIVGGAFSYTDSSLDLVNGDADGESYGLAAYATRMAENGVFMDFVARYGYLKNDIRSGNMKLDTDSNAFSLSTEVGHHFEVVEGAYVEPQIEITYGYVTGDEVRASNGVKIEQDDFQSLVGRVGVRTGFDLPQKAGTLYATASYSYEFLGDAEGTASKAGDRVKLDADLDGGWFTYGIGAQFRMSASAYAYGELERTTGGDVENPYRFNVGCRWMF